MKTQESFSKILSGVAGEYFVAAELSRMGYMASLTLRNANIDIQVSNDDATRYIGIQVKTNHNDRKTWLVGKKAEEYHAENLYYIFVNLKDKHSRPDYYIVPSKIVAKQVKDSFEQYKKTRSKSGKPRDENATMRNFWDKEGKYLEKWEIIHDALLSDKERSKD